MVCLHACRAKGVQNSGMDCCRRRGAKEARRLNAMMDLPRFQVSGLEFAALLAY